MLPASLAGQGLTGLSQERLGFGVGRAQHGGLAEGARQHVPDVALRQRLVLQQHLGQAVQMLLLLRLQGTACASAPTCGDMPCAAAHSIAPIAPGAHAKKHTCDSKTKQSPRHY